MFKLAAAAALAATLVVAARPAEAGCASMCQPWVGKVGAALGIAVTGAYAVGTGYFVYRDVADDAQTLDYGGAELGYNALFGSLFAAGAVEAIYKRKAGTALGLGSLAALHLTLAVHGGTVVYDRRDELRVNLRMPRISSDTKAWLIGVGYGLNTLGWAAYAPSAKHHTRTYGIVETSVNGSLALGLGYLAIDRANNDRTGSALLYGGMAALSTAFTIHGIRTILDPHDPPALDLLGTDVMPTAVSDGHEVAPGLGVSGTW